jgi:hypothetical protein
VVVYPQNPVFLPLQELYFWHYMNAKGRVWVPNQNQTRPAGPQLPLREAVNLRLTWAGMRPGFEDDGAILWDRDSAGRSTLTGPLLPLWFIPFRRFL